MITLSHSLVLAANAAWFGLGFRFFALRPRRTVRLLVPAATEAEVSRQALVEALPFLGGMNFAFAMLSAAELIAAWLHGPGPSWTIFFASGLAHASQLACNLPLA